MRPYVSIVIPAFNRSNVLCKPVESVLKQTFTNWELLVVDDGSRDDTEALMRKFMLSDIRIKFIKRPENRPKGANSCRNIGIENAKGKYVAFLDSDDEWNCEKLSEDVSFIEQHSETKAIHSGIQIDDGIKRYNGPARDVKENESYVDYIFSDDVLAQTSTFVVRREEALLVRFDESLQRHQDMDFFIRFGKSFGWHFRKSYNTMVHWKRGVRRNQHFESMTAFYHKYKAEVSTGDKKARYLTWAWVCAARFNKISKKFYMDELKEIFWSVSLKYRVFTLFPNLIFTVWKLIKQRS